MLSRDYYNVLGVERDTDEDGLKRAYRRLARKWHPDRNAGDKFAEIRFKALNEAYSVLSDPLQRERYDRMGPLWVPEGQPLSPGDVQAAFSQMWSNLRGKHASQPGETLRESVSISLEEVATGLTRTLTFARTTLCPDCNGLGAAPEDRALCEVCDGSGRSKGKRMFRTRCFHCEGRGYTITQRCRGCAGTGRIAKQTDLAVTIPAGVMQDDTLVLREQGNEPAGDGPPGDLIVHIDVATHPRFERDGRNLRLCVPIGVEEAILGAEVKIPTLTGHATIRLPRATPHGRLFRLAGRGLPERDSGVQGDLIVEIQIELPTQLSTASALELRAWAEDLQPMQTPLRTRFRDDLEPAS